MLEKIRTNRLFKDSFWAVFGNGLGYALLLFSGIMIARFLGRDVYGEYGVVKTTLLYMASFSAMGLGFSSTKYIAQFLQEDKSIICSIITAANKITLISSCVIAIGLNLFAEKLAVFLEEPSLAHLFRILSVIVICKAFSTTGIGILAGWGAFKKISSCNIKCGILMFILCIPLTYYCGINGALISLFVSQLSLALLVYFQINKFKQKLPCQNKKNMVKELFSFSLPIALQESSYSICNWGAIAIFTKLSSLGEVGLYSATTQWNAIIMFIPGFLSNVLLSHLSSFGHNKDKHIHTIIIMLIANLICTFIPFIIIFFCSSYISSFYGDTFCEMKNILRITMIAPIFSCCSTVFNSELLAIGKNWLLFFIRLIRDLMVLLSTYILLSYNGGDNGATIYASISAISAACYFFVLLFWTYYKVLR